MNKVLDVRWLGRCDYEEIAKKQRERREQVLSAEASEEMWKAS